MTIQRWHAAFAIAFLIWTPSTTCKFSYWIDTGTAKLTSVRNVLCT